MKLGNTAECRKRRLFGHLHHPLFTAMLLETEQYKEQGWVRS